MTIVTGDRREPPERVWSLIQTKGSRSKGDVGIAQ
jgi:hypothetical protein